MTRTSRIASAALTACAIAAPAASTDAGQELRHPDLRTPAPVPADSPASATVGDSRPLDAAPEAETTSDFAWSDAGIGAALVLSVSGAAVSVRRHRRRQTGTAIA